MALNKMCYICNINNNVEIVKKEAKMNVFKKQRLELELTQYDVEKLTGIRQSKLSLVERGFRVLNSEENQRLCKVLHLKEKNLLT